MRCTPSSAYTCIDPLSCLRAHAHNDMRVCVDLSMYICVRVSWRVGLSLNGVRSWRSCLLWFAGTTCLKLSRWWLIVIFELLPTIMLPSIAGTACLKRSRCSLVVIFNLLLTIMLPTLAGTTTTTHTGRNCENFPAVLQVPAIGKLSYHSGGRFTLSVESSGQVRFEL